MTRRVLGLLASLALAGCAPSPKPADTGCVLATWYPDADGDGFGDSARPADACDAPDGHVALADDCDDADADVFPGAEESCDTTADANCDGSIGDADADGDGWRACDDCDDADAAVSPDATETCDGVDQDCDGDVDENPADGLSGWTDADQDGFGDAAHPTVACAGASGWAEVDGDCDDADAGVYPGAFEACDDVDADCDGLPDATDARGGGTWYADADGDGYGDDATTTETCAPSADMVATGGDCDDADPDRNPDTTWYADHDRDGFGDPDTTVATCEPGLGWVGDATDCDDADPTAFPGGVEVCGGGDEDCDGTVDVDAADPYTFYLDADDDGWGDADSPTEGCDEPDWTVGRPGDCDDADADVSPDGIEVCDGVDQDCDGTVDEDATDAATWFYDADGDGFGEATLTTEGCDAPAGYVASGTDCDDGDPAAAPGGTETCDDGDDDCDGVVDAGATDAPTWYADTDGDGYGDPSSTVVACSAPTGFVADATDCDDADATVSPAGSESCSTTADDDCDGDAVEVDAPGCTEWYLDLDGDGYGSTSHQCTCIADGDYTATNTDDCADGDAARSPGEPEVWGDAEDDDCDGGADEDDLGDAGVALWGEATIDEAGQMLTGAGDLDGDGADDLLVGVYRADRGGSESGVVYGFSGAPTADGSLATADFFVVGEAAGDQAGMSAAVADADGDGVLDLLVGGPGNDRGGASAGTAFLLPGPLSGSVSVASATAFVTGDSVYDGVGYTARFAGDLDGDGVEDVAVGATGDTHGVGAYGTVSVLYGPISGTRTIAAADTQVWGGLYSCCLGARLAAVGDTDGDGLDDLLVGASSYLHGGSTSGAALLLAGPAATSGEIAGAADAILEGEANGDQAGFSVAGAGDVDLDGYADVLVGSGNGGRAYLVRGPARSASLAAADTVFVGDEAWTGYAVAGLGDVDGDGGPDIGIGSPETSTTDHAGEAEIFLHVPTGTVDVSTAEITLHGPDGSYAGTAIGPAGDPSGDGLADVLVGGFRESTAATYAGAAWFVEGR